MDTIKIINSLNIKYVHRRIKHHASHSGYSIVFEYLKIPVARSRVMAALIKFLPTSVRWRLHRFKPQPVGDDGLIPELLALPMTMSKKRGICHFIYGEDTYFYTQLWQHSNKKVIATYHYPPSRLEERVSKPLLKTLSAVILMSESQKSWFSEHLPLEKIFVVPHHVDTDFFIPKSNKFESDTYRIISLGGILRNMDLLLRVVVLMTEKLGQENIQFDFLIPKDARKPFNKFSNVNLHSRVSDEKLRSLYQDASIGFMPLEDCTANNAVLEMMACGKAIACSKVGGIPDYLDEQGAFLFPPDICEENLIEKLMELLEDTNKRCRMGEYNRAKALNEFSLHKTAEKLLNVYQQVDLSQAL